MEKRGLMWFVGILLLLWLLIGSYLLRNHFCDAKTEPQVTEKTVVPNKALGFSAEDGTFKTSADGYFRFPESTAIYEGASDKLRNSLSETATYLTANATKVLTITGYYTEDEATPDLLPNYGFARANTIKEELEALGVNASQLTTDGELANADNFQEGYITNGISFAFTEAVDGVDARLERIRENIVGNPLTLYFKSGDQSLNLDAAQKEDFADMIYFLDRIEGSSLEIGGHTDSQGEDKGNQRLSRKRAESVRDYVTGGGVSVDRMTAVGYGEEKPVGDNKYEAGRKENRRVEIILQEG